MPLYITCSEDQEPSNDFSIGQEGAEAPRLLVPDAPEPVPEERNEEDTTAAQVKVAAPAEKGTVARGTIAFAEEQAEAARATAGAALAGEEAT